MGHFGSARLERLARPEKRCRRLVSCCISHPPNGVFVATLPLLAVTFSSQPTTMVDVLLVVSIIVAFAILCVAAVYLLVYYQHPDDHNEAWIPKFVVIFGFVLAGATVLMFPLDVANNEGYAGKDIFKDERKLE